MPPIANDLFLRALRREPTETTPVWLMRQAGRYLPEYQATRARAGSFLALAKTPELACEVTLQPLERYALDAAILFSDILTVPDAMGLGLRMVEGEGPCFDRPLRTEADILALPRPDPEGELRYVMDAVRTIRGALAGRVPLIGFTGSPWTLACYMVEGQGGTDFRRIKTLMYERPELLDHLLQVTADSVADYLLAQIDAGAQAVMIFDTWGGILAHDLYPRHSLAPMRHILGVLQQAAKADPARKVPTIVFTKGGAPWLDQMADCGADALGLDWTVDLGRARALVGDRVALQGNLDPMALMGPPARIEAETRAVLDAFGPPSSGHGMVFNLGHGISQFTPPEHVSVLVDTVHEHGRRLRQNGAV